MTYDNQHGRSQENLLVTHNLFSAQSAGVGTFGVKCVNYGVDDVSLNYWYVHISKIIAMNVRQCLMAGYAHGHIVILEWSAWADDD